MFWLTLLLFHLSNGRILTRVQNIQVPILTNCNYLITTAQSQGDIFRVEAGSVVCYRPVRSGFDTEI